MFLGPGVHDELEFAFEINVLSTGDSIDKCYQSYDIAVQQGVRMKAMCYLLLYILLIVKRVISRKLIFKQKQGYIYDKLTE